MQQKTIHTQRQHLGSDSPDTLTFDWQKIAKKLTFFSKVFGNFLTVKWQFSGGSAYSMAHVDTSV